MLSAASAPDGRHATSGVSIDSLDAAIAVVHTGSGKSLCYQLPALLLGGTTLVVSPLIALMRDQLARLPPQLPAAMLWGGQSKQEAVQVLADLKASAAHN